MVCLWMGFNIITYGKFQVFSSVCAASYGYNPLFILSGLLFALSNLFRLVNVAIMILYHTVYIGWCCQSTTFYFHRHYLDYSMLSLIDIADSSKFIAEMLEAIMLSYGIINSQSQVSESGTQWPSFCIKGR